MNDIKISLNTVGDDNQITLVRVDGVIDTMTATELEKVISSLLDQRRFNIIVDLAGVDYISSAGWGIFISNIREIRQQSGDIKLARMIPNVYEIFELLEFDSILRSFDDLEEAKADFGELSPDFSSGGAGSGAETGNTGGSGDMKTSGKTGESSDSESASTESDKRGFDEKIKSVIKRDPFLSIGEIKRELQSDDRREENIGWWGVFKWLYSNNLATRKSRYQISKER